MSYDFNSIKEHRIFKFFINLTTTTVCRNLESHFRSSHYLCEDMQCILKRYIVFSNNIDLAAHTVSMHPLQQVIIVNVNSFICCFHYIPVMIE